jgi:hypothetical protein
MGDSAHIFLSYNLAAIVGVVELVAGVLLTIGSLVFVRVMGKGSAQYFAWRSQTQPHPFCFTDEQCLEHRGECFALARRRYDLVGH